MRVEESNGKTILLLDGQDDLNTLFNAFNSPDKETAGQHKARLGRLLDPLLKGRKIDEIQHVFADYGTGEIIDYYAKNTFNRPIKYKNDERTLVDLISYLSDAKREELMSKNKVIRDFLRKNYDQVVGQLKEKAAEYEAKDSEESAEIAKNIGTNFSDPILPPLKYRKILKKYGSRRSNVTHSRPVRRTRKRKLTLRTVGL